MKKLKWDIVFEDESLMLINKPSGLLTIPDRYDPLKPNLYNSLQSYREAIFINHRLDRETSGLIVFSKTEASHKFMQEQFEKKKISKSYLTIVNGSMPASSGVIELKMSPSSSGKKLMVIDKKGKNSSSYYEVVTAWKNYSLVKVDIATGRTHQIRLHMKTMGCPIVCDTLYGDGEPFYLSRIKRKYHKTAFEEERPLINRVALHAHRLSFIHPETKKVQTFEADPPKDMQATINQLNKLNIES